MWKVYRELSRQYQRISLSEERRLIREAQNGSKKCTEEIVLRHIGFVIFRIHKKTFPGLIRKYGEDLLEDSIVILYQKVETYNLKYRDQYGNLKPVKFISYIWKRIDGFILDSLKRELQKEKKARYHDNQEVGFELNN